MLVGVNLKDFFASGMVVVAVCWEVLILLPPNSVAVVT